MHVVSKADSRIVLITAFVPPGCVSSRGISGRICFKLKIKTSVWLPIWPLHTTREQGANEPRPWIPSVPASVQLSRFLSRENLTASASQMVTTPQDVSDENSAAQSSNFVWNFVELVACVQSGGSRLRTSIEHFRAVADVLKHDTRIRIENYSYRYILRKEEATLLSPTRLPRVQGTSRLFGISCLPWTRRHTSHPCERAWYTNEARRFLQRCCVVTQDQRMRVLLLLLLFSCTLANTSMGVRGHSTKCSHRRNEAGTENSSTYTHPAIV